MENFLKIYSALPSGALGCVRKRMNVRQSASVLAVVLLVTTLVSTVGLGYAYCTVDLGEVRIGVILPDQNSFPSAVAIKLAEQDLSRMYTPGVKAHFTFDIRYMSEGWNTGQEIDLLNNFSGEGVNLVIGGFYSGPMYEILGSGILEANNQLIFSPSSTGSGLQSADRFFRMCPTDVAFMRPLVDMIYSRGYRDVVMLVNDGYSKDNFVSANTKLNILGEVWVDSNDIDSALNQASGILSEHPGLKIAILDFCTDPMLLVHAKSYPDLYGLNWFTGYAKNLQFQIYTPRESADLRLFGQFQVAPPASTTLYNNLMSRFAAVSSSEFSTYTANCYDIAMVYAKSVIAAKSKDATIVMNVLPSVSAKYLGATGYCVLDEYGDRANCYYSIMGYYLKNTVDPVMSYTKSFGYADPYHNKVVWNTQNEQ
jgi:hypothetical protein